HNDFAYPLGKHKLPVPCAPYTLGLCIAISGQDNIPAEKVAFIIEIYNVADVNSTHKFQLNEDVLGNKFSMSNHTSQVLVQIISIPINLTVQHFNKDYLIFIGFWCRDLDFEFKYFTYSPLEKKIVTEGTLKEGNLLTDELTRIRE
ncbi:MAG: hypothetical protein B7Y83_12325, partial [Flavobacteriales bacterium 32-34-25]